MLKLVLRTSYFAFALLAGCSLTVWKPDLYAPARPPSYADLQSPLKVHLRSGQLVVLDAARITESPTDLSGRGVLYSAARQRIRADSFRIPLDSIALLETNTAGSVHPFGLTLMATWTVITGGTTAYCLADPKSCFGSCPTFYADADSAVPAAEGFSSSIARVLEARDVDALYDARAGGGTFALTMRNEALETHAVRWVRLLAAPRPPGGRVLATGDGRFFDATELTAPTRCEAPEGDCLDAVRARDRRERRSTADSTDLAARETIELDFPAAAGPLGLVVAARHSFVSTFVFYQTLAYMGRGAADLFAALERGDTALAAGVARADALLGGIDVAVRDGDVWRDAGSFAEMGPIAADVQIVPLGEVRAGAGQVHLRLTLAKGGWRVDWLALARLGAAVSPVTLEPAAVTRGGAADSGALAALRDSARYLVTYPGDVYRISFTLPDHLRDPELLLDTRGYYYEWMRPEWLREEDPALLALALARPDAYLHRLAPAFKRIEPDMERLFWSSRFGR